MQVQPSREERNRYRFGLMKVRVDSCHVVCLKNRLPARRTGGERGVQVTARSADSFRDAKITWHCVWCRDHNVENSSFESEAALIAAHPPRATMQKNQEAHVVFGWSTDPDPWKVAPLSAELDVQLDAIEASGASKEDRVQLASAAKAAHARLVAALPVIGMVTSDEAHGEQESAPTTWKGEQESAPTTWKTNSR